MWRPECAFQPHNPVGSSDGRSGDDRTDLRHPWPHAPGGVDRSKRNRFDHPCWRHWQAGIIEQLSVVAPVVAVRGNVDKGVWASHLPMTAVAEAGSALIYVLHDIQQLDLNPTAAEFNIVVSGHSHQPSHTERAGVMYLNPGSAGPRRFHLPVTVARLNLRRSPWTVEFIDLSDSKLPVIRP